MSLFWYPALNIDTKIFDAKYNKSEMLQSYIRYYLARLQSMFIYDGLPDSIPQKWLEHYLMCNGNCIVTEVDGVLYAFTGGQCEVANAYYIPKGYVVANPWVKTDGGTLSETYWIESTEQHEANACIIYNDTYSQGLIPMLTKYCSQLVENDITMNLADILARATIAISAADDNIKASAELWLKRLKDGELGIMSDNAFLDQDSLNIRDFKSVAQVLTDLIEYHQYIKASLYNELGLNSNYNMKRESINSNESQLNDDMLHPLIDDMLKERKEAVERINKMFGTSITVEFNSAWALNERESEAAIEVIETQAEKAEAEAETAEAEADQIEIQNDVIEAEADTGSSDDAEADQTEDAAEENGTGMLQDSQEVTEDDETTD